MTSAFQEISLSIALLIIGATSIQAALTPADSSGFVHKYEANALPQTEDPIYSKLGGYTPSVAGGILTYNSIPGGPGGGIWWTAASTYGTEHALGGAFTVEIRARIVDSVGDINSLQVWVGGPAGDGSIAYLIGKDSVGYYGPGNVLLADSLDNSADFHTYRIAREAGSSDYHFFRDTDELGVVPSGEFTFGPDLYFGDGGSSAGAHVEIDYFRWTTTGAFSPVPEPASLILIGIGSIGFVALSRRRHFLKRQAS